MATKVITSRDNPAVKALRALAADSREQRRLGRTVLDGPHLVAAYVERMGTPERLVVSESGLRNAEIGRLLEVAAAEVLTVPDSLFRELAGMVEPVGLLAVIAIPEPPATQPTGNCVLLDAVQDAGNVGTILRTAAAAGIRDIALGPGCAGAWTPKVLRAAQGAHFCLRIREPVSLPGLIEQRRETVVAAVAQGGRSLYEEDLSGEVAWLFGNEGSGISPSLMTMAGHTVTIPMAAGSESLNVAAAAAVCMFEGVRQRLADRGKR